jgi:imidazolonepropionase-like amidohydrolase
MVDTHQEYRDRGSRYVDAHVHITHPDALRDLAAAGMSAVRDAGSKKGVGLLAEQRALNSRAPVVISAGRALSRQGGYGAFLGSPVSTQEEMAAEIHKLSNEGADIIKVIASGAVSFEQPGKITAGGFEADDIRFIVEEARRHGLTVMAHANGEKAIRAAAEAGVRSIEHGFFMTEAALDLLAKRKVFWVPTAGALRRAALWAEARPEVLAFIQQEIERHLVMLGKAFRIGVPLAVGTDCVLPDRRYRSYYDNELAFFRAASIPHDAVESIACEGGAKLLGI